MKQQVTYWEPTGTKDVFGKMEFKQPRELKGRWEDKVELIRDKHGEEVTSMSRVFVVERLNVDGYVYLGLINLADPLAVEGAYEIRAVKFTPDLRNIKTLTVAFL